MSTQTTLAFFVLDLIGTTAVVAARDAIAGAAARQIAGDTGFPGDPEITRYDDKTVEFRYNRLSSATQSALDVLRNNSPARSGKYRQSFFLITDGTYHAPGSRPDIGTAQQVVIGNLEPYNRKVEVQTTSGRPIRFSVPPGVYEAAARQVTEASHGTVAAQVIPDLSEFPGRYQRKRGGAFTSPALVLTMADQPGWFAHNLPPILGSVAISTGIASAAPHVMRQPWTKIDHAIATFAGGIAADVILRRVL